jgi:hypothetical protein
VATEGATEAGAAAVAVDREVKSSAVEVGAAVAAARAALGGALIAPSRVPVAEGATGLRSSGRAAVAAGTGASGLLSSLGGCLTISPDDKESRFTPVSAPGPPAGASSGREACFVGGLTGTFKPPLLLAAAGGVSSSLGSMSSSEGASNSGSLSSSPSGASVLEAGFS